MVVIKIAAFSLFTALGMVVVKTTDWGGVVDGRGDPDVLRDFGVAHGGDVGEHAIGQLLAGLGLGLALAGRRRPVRRPRRPSGR